ncbi:MAG: exodeoxyribonuclease VII large subunit [Methanosphaera stadtmanae]|nr:exodeoxyribonuclease VII large subunit [Methanosphaera stadtmanae]
MNKDYVTVSEINAYLNDKLKSDLNLRNLYVRGEISNYKTYPSGHSYFTLKDKDSEISAVMFGGYKSNLRFEPKDGMKVIINGKIEMYEVRGNLQLYAFNIIEDGIGELYVAYQQLKKKLEKEGLFDENHKKEIPKYPEKIGVVTAKTGAAVKDIITTIKRRYPYCEVLVFSTLVQGDRAAEQIVEQIRHAQNYNLDTLIVGRGGGSIEDLWPFNEEIVAREIYNCETPIISAVGHEIDYTISDFVADKRAATPTAAAELAVPQSSEIKFKIEQYKTMITNSLMDKLNQNKYVLEQISKKQILKNPETMYNIKQMHLDGLIGRFDAVSKKILMDNKNKLFELENSMVLKNPEFIIKNKKEEYLRNVGKLEVLNPLLTLKRGYTITKVNDKVISSVKDLHKEDELEVVFDDGSVKTRVI